MNKTVLKSTNPVSLRLANRKKFESADFLEEYK